MLLKSFKVLHHPHLSESFLVETRLIEKWKEKNYELWSKTGIDPDLFIPEDLHIMSKELSRSLLKEFPEFFL